MTAHHEPLALPERAPHEGAERPGLERPVCLPGSPESCRLEPIGVVSPVQPLAEHLRSRVIGQRQAIEPLVRGLQRSLAGLEDPSRPLLTALLLGPTGVGKTETAKALASGLLGAESALTRIDCEEYAHGFELSKLLGSPPGYIGFNVEPLLSQERIDAGHASLREQGSGASGAALAGMADRLAGGRDRKLSILLFDEVEKASPKVWSALLGVLDDGRLTLGDNSTTDFTRSIILMTTNVGSRSIGELLEEPRLGFRLGAGDATEGSDPERLREVALDAARRHFPAEFLNRFDEQLVYGPLGDEDLLRIFDRMVADLQVRVLERSGVPFLLKVSEGARALLVARGADSRYGARPLRRVIDAEIVGPLAGFVACGAVAEGDVVEVTTEEDGERLAFVRGARGPRAVVA
ncbi:MAG TPA: AAA family ATPase [Thermoanaerobaculia bacterium]|nr:AAA family ATPase [Thermoanaerobaculia bacterium]